MIITIITIDNQHYKRRLESQRVPSIKKGQHTVQTTEKSWKTVE